jgi:uncharacterized delta-60 repeat protein
MFGRQIYAVLLLAAVWTATAAEMVDTTFNAGGAGADNIVEQVLEAPDGKILICGLFARYNNIASPWIARLNADGSLDTNFNASPNYWVRHMVVQPDGKIVIAGEFSSVEGVPRNLIARLNSDGSLDQSFDPGTGLETMIAPDIYNNPIPFVIWTDLQPDGKILALGNFKTYNGFPSQAIVRINPDGSRDTNFNVGTGFDSWARSTVILRNKQILVTGWFNTYKGQTYNRLIRLNEDGSIDPTLNAFYGTRTSVYSAVTVADGKLITAGHSLNEQGLFNREIVRLNPDGSVDESWPGRTNEKTECLLQQDDGKVIAVGYFTTANYEPRLRTARFNADGTLDPTFIANANGLVWTVAPARDQRILICGQFSAVNGVPAGNVARINLPERAIDADVHMEAQLIEGKVRCTVETRIGKAYVLEYKTGVDLSTWTELAPITGTGGVVTLAEEIPNQERFYRVEVR